MTDLKKLGKLCKRYRRGIGKTQLQVAFDIDYSVVTVSNFECGRNDSFTIFLWYIKNGLKVENVISELTHDN